MSRIIYKGRCQEFIVVYIDSSGPFKYCMINANSMIPLAHVQVRDRDYCVYISMCVISRRMHIFKYNELSCDYDVFERESDACEFIEQPLPKYRTR